MDAGEIAQQAGKLLDEQDRFRGRLIHLPVANEQACAHVGLGQMKRQGLGRSVGKCRQSWQSIALQQFQSGATAG